MTNAEKFKEVFGVEPTVCPSDCISCVVPLFGFECTSNSMWWKREYKEPNHSDSYEKEKEE